MQTACLSLPEDKWLETASTDELFEEPQYQMMVAMVFWLALFRLSVFEYVAQRSHTSEEALRRHWLCWVNERCTRRECRSFVETSTTRPSHCVALLMQVHGGGRVEEPRNAEKLVVRAVMGRFYVADNVCNSGVCTD